MYLCFYIIDPTDISECMGHSSSDSENDILQEKFVMEFIMFVYMYILCVQVAKPNTVTSLPDCEKVLLKIFYCPPDYKWVLSQTKSSKTKARKRKNISMIIFPHFSY